MRQHVFVAMPCRSGFPWIATMKSVITAMPECARQGILMSFVDCTGNPIIAMARNLMLAQFHKTESATDLLFVDDDVVFPEGSVTRILSHDVDLVGGVYPRRFDPPGYNVRLLDEERTVRPDGLLEVEGLPGGFMRIRRSCLDKLLEAYMPDCYFEAESDPNVFGYDLFDKGREGTRYWGEDYEFCRKWRAIGGTVWADTTIPFIHAGFKEYAGVGPWIDWLKGKRDGDGSRHSYGGT